MLGWFKKKIRKDGEEVKPVPVEEQIIPSAAEIVAPSSDQDEAVAPSGPESFSQTPSDGATQEDDTFSESAGGASFSALENLEEEKEKKESLFQRLTNRLSKTRESFIKRVDSLFLGKKVIDAELLDELEEILITADLGVSTTQALLEGVRERVKRKELSDPLALKSAIKEKIFGYLEKTNTRAELAVPETGPFIIMVLGVNGVGKTTTIGKLAYKFVNSGQKTLLVAADTFRAAAIDQLKIWGERIGVEVVAQKQGADPSSVIYDALDYARPRHFDVIIVDTAGRLHTKVNLMEELKKIKRVMDKKHPGAPHEILLVLDATTGQNAISQAKMFHDAVQVSGIALTKLDGTAKGGIVVNICHTFNIPIRFIGIGEKLHDLRDFDPREFVEALFAGGDFNSK